MMGAIPYNLFGTIQIGVFYVMKYAGLINSVQDIHTEHGVTWLGHLVQVITGTTVFILFKLVQAKHGGWAFAPEEADYIVKTKREKDLLLWVIAFSLIYSVVLNFMYLQEDFSVTLIATTLMTIVGGVTLVFGEKRDMEQT